MKRYKQLKPNLKEAKDDTYYYISGNKGMKASGSFTSDKSSWITFTQDDKESIEDSPGGRPYGATKMGKFINVNKF